MPPQTDETRELSERIARLEAKVTKLEQLTKGSVEAVIWAGLAVVAAVLLVKVHRPTAFLWPHVFNAAHVVLAGVAALVALRVSRRLLAGLHAGADYVVALATVLVLGGGLELAQFIAPGEPSLRDLGRDLLGALAALILAVSVDRRRDSKLAASSGRRWLLRVVALCLLAVGLRPLATVAYAFGMRARAFPVLASFEDRWETHFVLADDGAALARQAPPPAFTRARGSSVGKVVFGPGSYPKLELTGLLRTWSGYSALVFEVYSPEVAPCTLRLRIHDHKHTNQYDDRFNAELTIDPGQTTVSIPVDRIRRGPSGRQLEMDALESLILFVATPAAPVTLYFDDFRLEGPRASANP